jgi:hypothetical protein
MNARGQYGTRVGDAIDPRFAARRRAVRAVFDMYAYARAPYYVYAEVNGIVDKRAAQSLEEASAIFSSFDRAPGEVYVAIFDASDAVYWPGPSRDVYRPVVSESSARVAGVESTLATGASDVWAILKFGAWAVLGVGTVVALSSVVQNLRSGQDPAAKYMELFRARRAHAGPMP